MIKAAPLRERSPADVRVIVTADDFGLSPAVDRGIIEAFLRGVVRNTALLVNFPDLGESLGRLERAAGLEVGIHLNVTAGPPVMSPDRIPSLVTADGVFPGFGRFFARVGARRIDPSDVMREWGAQIELGLKMGCRFTSVTSHQHVHMLPALARVAVELSQRFKIPAVRLTRFHRTSMFPPLRLKALALAAYAGAVRRTLTERRVLHNDFVVDIPAQHRNTALQRFCGMVRCLPRGVFEVVSHPAYLDATLRQRDALVDQRGVDLEVLTAPAVAALVTDGQIALSTFGALAAERCG